jgi:hypothetical protein
MPPTEKKLPIYLSPDAVATEEGIELRGTKNDFESLAGWVAGDANPMDRRKKRTIELLHEICDELESAVASRAIGW